MRLQHDISRTLENAVNAEMHDLAAYSPTSISIALMSYIKWEIS